MPGCSVQYHTFTDRLMVRGTSVCATKLSYFLNFSLVTVELVSSCLLCSVLFTAVRSADLGSGN